jgi:hypothetical protein
MGKSTPSAPQPANPQNVAHDQSVANVNTAVAQAYLNNVNQVTPYGTLKYTPGPGTTVDGIGVPTFTASQELTPAGQKLLDTQMSINQGTSDLANQYVSRIADATAKPYSYDGLPAAPTYNADYVAKATQGIIDRNQPQMDRDRANLEQRLANQGISVGSEAYKAAMDQYGRSVNDFRLGAQTQGQGMAAQQYGLEANTRDRAISEMTNQRTQPINEVSALMGTGTGVQNPNFVNTPQTQVAPTDVIGAYNNAYQQQYANYNSQLQANNAMTGGLFGLGGTVLGMGMRYGLRGGRG